MHAAAACYCYSLVPRAVTMKTYIVALVIIVTLVACARGRAVGDSTHDEEGQQCPYASQDLNEYELFQTLANSQRRCLVGDVSSAIRRMTEAESREALRKVFVDLCAAGASEFRRCLAQIDEDGRRCLDARTTAHKMFHTVRDFIEATLDTACSNRSVSVSALLYELIHLGDESMTDADTCMGGLEATRITDVADLTAEFSHSRYQTVRDVKECIVGVIETESDAETGDVGRFFDEVLAKMTCISFETSEVGLCETM